jgi:predicted kinase
VILRSDEIRKRLWGIAPTERLPNEAYGPGESERVYGRMFEAAAACLRAGRSVVLDAVFLKPAERAQAQAVAAACGAPFAGAWLEAPEVVLRERISGRHGDASDADIGVLAQQLKHDPGEIGWRRLDARDDFGQMTRTLLSPLGD